MNKTNILVIDKDVLVRQAVAQVLQREQSFGVVTISDKIEDANRLILDKKPNVVLLDVDSADSGGLAVLNLIRVRFPHLPVVVLSPRTEQGAAAAITALRLGAVDVVTKPEYPNSVLFAGRHFRRRILPIVKAAAELSKIENRVALRQEPFVHSAYRSPQKRSEETGAANNDPVSLIVIGGCTGGPKSLFTMIPQLPADFPVPIVIVQHFPQKYTAALTQELNELSDINVREVEDNVELLPGTVWVATGGYHCEVNRVGNRDTIRLHRGQRENNNRPSIDGLFRSASRLYGPEVLGVILSGCIGDGLTGSEIIKSAGGRVLVQDPRTALAPDMPRSVIRAGVFDKLYSPDELANQIIWHAGRSREVMNDRLARRRHMENRSSANYSRNQKDLFV